MATQQTRTPLSETLPAIRPISPSGGLRPSSKSMHESMTLPPIQSLTREFPSRLEHAHSDPNLLQRNSPPDQNGYHRKRAATGEVTGNLSPPSASKRRRLESTESNGASAELAAIPTTAAFQSPSVRHGHSRQTSGIDSQHLTPPTLPNNASLLQQTSRATVSHPQSHEHRRNASSSGTASYAVHSYEGPLKQEQISPPAVVVQSPATPSTLPSASSNSAAWQNESASFSRRISNASSSSPRPTGRKQPPSRLNFQPHHAHKSSLEANIAPSIRSAPPVPVPGRMIPPRPPQPAAGASWISRASSSSQLRPSHNTGPATPDLTPRAIKGSELWPSIPTPTTLRLSHAIVPPPLPTSNPNVSGARSPSARLPITPAVPSPIPTLGASTGSVAEKARFMAKMSEIYDRASVHKQCISAEDIDRRIKHVLASRDHEIVQLKKDVAELQKLLRGPGGGVMDLDGDVTMAHHLQPNARETSSEAPASRAMTTSPSPQPGEARKEGVSGQIPEELALPAAPTIPATLLANGKHLAGAAASPETSPDAAAKE